jgi:hypothetical protein
MTGIDVVGIGYVPDYEYGGTHMLIPEQMTRELAASVVSLPVYIEHDTSVPIGEVSMAHIDDKMRLVVTLKIFNNPLIVSHLSDCIALNGNTGRRALFTGISAGTRVQLRRTSLGDGEHYMAPVGQVEFSEFSIVETPDSPECLILDWDFRF